MDSSQAIGSESATQTQPHPSAVEEARKIVTVVFFDMVDSTGTADNLDLESNDQVMDRYRDVVREVIEHHQGTMGPWQGDGVMAVFGIPVLYEDHALRAVKAAADVHRRLGSDEREPELELKIRTGIHTGEVLVNPNVTPEEITGDTPNVADRLQRKAEPNQTLMSEATWHLVRNAVDYRSVGSLELKGKSQRMPTYRLVSVDPEAQLRHTSANVPMVGRTSEHNLLTGIYERAMAQSTCHLVTVFGPAGVGKSRLIEEFRENVKDQALVLAGHCLPYGESITYWPMVQLVRRVAEATPTDELETVRTKLEELVGEQEDGRVRILSYLAQMLSIGPGAGSPADISWALRRLLEILARKQPLVVIIDDLHWAEQTLLDAIEHIADEAREAPILLVCMTRQELLEHRATWAGGKLNSSSMCLPPLNDDEQRQLIDHLVPQGQLDEPARGRIARLARGFPLYALEYVALVEDKLRPAEGKCVEVADLEKLPAPATITALLSARLAHLHTEEQRVIERAAVVGEQFHTADIVELCSDLFPGPTVERSLRTLLRQDLIRLDRSPVPLLPVKEGGNAYRFRHVLTQETAYNGMAKRTRASLHERYADWLEREAGPERLSQFEELLGSHLGEAGRYRVELGQRNDEDRRLARQVGKRLADAGHRAAIGGNMGLTERLLNRAVELLPEGHAVWLEASLDRADALREAGKLEQATQVYRKVVEQATAADDQGVAMHAQLGRLDVMAFSAPERMLLDGDALVEQAIILFAERGDDLGLVKARRLKAYMHFATGHAAEAEQAARYAIDVARSKGYEYLEAKIRRLLCIVLFWGQTPLDEVVGYSTEALKWARSKGFPGLEAGALGILARAAAMQGDFEKARRLNQNAKAITKDLGESLTAAADSVADGFVELLADDPDTAVAKLRVGYEALKEMGGTGPLANVAAMLARAHLIQMDDDGAERLIRVCREITAESQVDTQIRWRNLQAVILARRGDLERAEQLATEAVAMADRSEQPDTRAEARLDLADVLRLAGRPGEAAGRAHQALELYEAKGNQVAAGKVRKLLARLN